VITPTIAAAAIGLPAGLIIQDLLIQHLAAQAGMVLLPAKFVHVLGAADLVLPALAGLDIAIAGTLGPASWAAGTRAATALHAE
jgi:putative ABC transport system permease protein